LSKTHSIAERQVGRLPDGAHQAGFDHQIFVRLHVDDREARQECADVGSIRTELGEASNDLSQIYGRHQRAVYSSVHPVLTGLIQQCEGRLKRSIRRAAGVGAVKRSVSGCLTGSTGASDAEQQAPIRDWGVATCVRAGTVATSGGAIPCGQ
jgi:hypothetical protein